jgi:hypothetical protein
MSVIAKVASRLLGLGPSPQEEGLAVPAEAGPAIAAEVERVVERERELRSDRALRGTRVDGLLGERDEWVAKAAIPDRTAERERLLLAAAEGDARAEAAIERLDAEDKAARRSAEVATAKLRQLDERLAVERAEYHRAVAAHDAAVTELAEIREWLSLHRELTDLPTRVETKIAALFATESEIASLQRLARRLRRGAWRYPLAGDSEAIRRLEDLPTEIDRRRPTIAPEEPVPVPPPATPLVPKGATTSIGMPSFAGKSERKLGIS